MHIKSQSFQPSKVSLPKGSLSNFCFNQDIFWLHESHCIFSCQMLLDVGDRGLSLSQLGVLSQRQWLFVFFNTKCSLISSNHLQKQLQCAYHHRILVVGDVRWYQKQNCRIQGQEQEVELSFNLSIIYLSHPLLFRDFVTKTVCLTGSGLAFIYLAGFEKILLLTHGSVALPLTHDHIF